MGFWYLNAGLGPKSPCATTTGTPPRFDTVSGTADNTINESAYSRGAPFDLTGATYSCTSADGQTKLAWDGTTLTIKGTVFIDGSAKSSTRKRREVRRQGDDHPQRALLDGQQHRALREPSGRRLQYERALGCRHHRPRDRRGRDRPLDRRSRNSIDIKKGNFQGLLLGNGNIDASVSGTLVIGPMVSVYGSVNAGQSGTLQFPPITFASSGTDGLTGPLPLPELLSPIEFGG